VVTKTDGTTVTLPAGGRGVDDNGDGIIGPDEGMNTLAAGPLALVTQRDGYNQAVIDAMQLVRVIQRGIDVNDDSIPDLDPSRIYFWGASLSGIWGTDFVALEPAVRAAVIGPAGGPIVDAGRLGINRPSIGQLLSLRSPSLLNDGPVDPFTNTIFPFDENLPLRNQPPVINDVPGAIAIQQVLDRLGWAMQSSNPVAYAPHLRRAPLVGVAPGPVLFMFAKGDKTVPNPTTTALLRAGELRDRTLYYRYDLEPRDANGHPVDASGHQLFPNDDPHTFAGKNAAVTATFLASDGTQISDPDGPGPLWETPIAGPLPEDRSFIGPTTFANPKPS
jgi:hypothetical protein